MQRRENNDVIVIAVGKLFFVKYSIYTPLDLVITELSTGRVGSGRVGSGRAGSRFCRILAGRVGILDFSGFNDYFLVHESSNTSFGID